ncbi:MAG TPA: hypothetical protein VKE42_00090, partial [Candidatus Cybelea sp.]|nr:hypothetical protein [Candidatus Cybelea sp.]
MAGFPITHLRILYVGTMTTKNTDTTLNGTATPNVPIVVSRQMDADHLFGIGSELAAQFRAGFANNWANETWALPVAESAASVEAHGTITVKTPPTDAGTISLYIAGYPVRVNIAATATVAEVAQQITDDINALPHLPVTATVATAVVTLKAKWGGVTGNEITMTDSIYGTIGGEFLPPGLTLAYEAGATPTASFTLQGGVGFPDFTTAIAALGETEYEYVSLPYLDSTSLLAWETEYGFSDSGRWGWMRQLYGHLFSAKRDTYSNLVTWGLTRNGKVTSVLALEPT